MEYCEKLHLEHSDFPFCPELKIPPSYCEDDNCKIPKLLCNLENKKDYVSYYLNIQHMLYHGLKITKVSRIMKFQQKQWMKSFIDFNNDLRTKATNDFEKSIYKLMNNSCYGGLFSF